MDCNKNEMDDNIKPSDCMQRSIETNNNFETNKETNSSVGGDIDSSQSDGVKTLESREERFKRLKEKSEIERQRKFTEILESQRQSSELRQRQQEERRKKIEELKQREEERKKKVEQRRQEMDSKEQEKNENFLKRTKEREERAQILQKQIRMTPAMTQSMTSTNQNRMTASIHSSGASSGSEKCTKVFNRSSSGCDVDRVTSYVQQAAGSKSVIVNTPRLGKKQPQIPDGFIEVDGNIIPANTRHAGCFVAYKGSHHKVKGVLAWGPPSDRVSERGSSVSWWAGIGERGGHKPLRATSAHASLVGSHCRTHLSTPHHLDKISLMDNEVVDIDITPKTERSASDAASKVSARLSVKLVKTMSLRHLEPTKVSFNRSSGKEPLASPRVRSSSRNRTTVTPTVRTPRQPNPKPTKTATGDGVVNDRLSKPRSGSQPPKNGLNDSIVQPPKSMSTSFSKSTPRVAPAKIAPVTVKPVVPVSTPVATITKKPSHKPKPAPISSSDSGLTASPVSEMDPVQDSSVVNGTDGTSEITNTTATSTTSPDEVPATKSRPKKSNKNLQSKELEQSVTTENTTTPEIGAVVTEEEMYRQKLAEQRRLKREAKERQQEEQRKLEEEAKERALVEKKRIEEETRQLIEDEARRIEELAIKEQEALEKQKIEEEIEQTKKDELEKELEDKRQDKLRSDDLDRMERKRRLEQIMIRVKKTDDSNCLANEECNSGNFEGSEQANIGEERNDQLLDISLAENTMKQEGDVAEEERPSEPLKAWDIGNDPIKATTTESGREEVVQEVEALIENADSSSVIVDEVVNVPVPQTNIGSMSQSQIISTSDNIEPTAPPQFKSRLLQSMMAKGRLTTSSTDIRRNSLVNSSMDPPLPSSSDKSNTANKRQSLILSQINGDAVNVTDGMSHSISYHSGISKMSASMIDCDQSRNGLLYESEMDEGHLSNGKPHHSDTEHEVTLCSDEARLYPGNNCLPDRETDGHSSGTTCSQLVAPDVRPSPVASQALELS